MRPDIHPEYVECTVRCSCGNTWTTRSTKSELVVDLCNEYGIDVVGKVPAEKFDAVILAVAHKEFLDLDVRALVHEGGVVYDVKGVLDRKMVDARL